MVFNAYMTAYQSTVNTFVAYKRTCAKQIIYAKHDFLVSYVAYGLIKQHMG